jgi:hypothetical protein
MSKHDEAAGQNGRTTVFGTAEEARAAKPEKHPKWKVWKVAGPNGAERYLWADGVGHALRQIALADGYAAACLDKQVNKATLAAGLAALTPEERAILIAQYVPAPAAPKKTK